MNSIHKSNGVGLNRGERLLSLTRLCLGALIAICAVILVVGRSHSAFTPTPDRSATLPSHDFAPRSMQAPAREGVRFVRFNLFDQTILPREIHVTAGLVAVAIEDYTGGTTGLVVERDSGQAPQQIGIVVRGGPEGRGQGEMRLTPGSYKVYMADRLDNHALLIVEP